MKTARRAKRWGAIALAGAAGVMMVDSIAAPPPKNAPVANIDRRDAIVVAVEDVGPAVVNISTEVVIENQFYRGGLFEQFFGRRQPRRQIENSLGSGVIVHPDGFVLTNDHVISQASRITVLLRDGRQVEADVVGTDRNSDLAVLKLGEKGPWPYVQMGNSSDLMIGETLIAIGNPFGLENTVTVGVLSAINRSLRGPDRGAVPFADFIQTDAAINPGNSGGALLNIRGQLVGINTQVVADGENLGFAIPIDRARRVFDELVRFNRVRPAWTGMTVEDLDPRMARSLGLDANRGLMVRTLYRDGPAAKAGIEAGDILLALDGRPLTSASDYETAIANVRKGSTVGVEYLRDDSTKRTRLLIDVFPESQRARYLRSLLGFSVKNFRDVVIVDDVDPRSYLGRAGLPNGWRLVSIDGELVKSEDEVLDIVPRLVNQRSVHLKWWDGRGFKRASVPLQ